MTSTFKHALPRASTEELRIFLSRASRGGQRHRNPRPASMEELKIFLNHASKGEQQCRSCRHVSTERYLRWLHSPANRCQRKKLTLRVSEWKHIQESCESTPSEISDWC